MTHEAEQRSAFIRAAVSMAIVTVSILWFAGTARAQRPGPPGAAFTEGRAPASIDAVVIHPIVAVAFTCSEHAFHEADPIILGDATGADCTVVEYDTQPAGRRPPRHYENDGSRNEDWFGWGETLLAPFDGVIEEIHTNPVTNTPGTPGKGPASFIVFLRADGTRVVYGHIRNARVTEGDTVAAGQPVADVGNNGFGYMPHTHVGAWRDGEPLQVRFDLVAMGALRRAAVRSER
ncbi:MAG TPA: M23 family metallopeptidase [Longimicrobiales bacterium]